MQNKPNSLRGQINATLFVAKDYENKPPLRTRKNKPKTNPIQTQSNPISEKPKMNLNFYSTKDYENKPPRPTRKNEPKANPNKPNFRSPKLPTPPNSSPPAMRNLALSKVEGTKSEILP